MKKQEKEKRNVQVMIRLTREEHEQFKELAVNSPRQSFSSFLSKKIFDQTVPVFYRNRSIDDFAEQLIGIKRSLDNLVEKKGLTEPEDSPLLLQIAEIKELMIKFSDTCLPISSPRRKR
jgi:hypothetical protein